MLTEITQNEKLLRGIYKICSPISENHSGNTYAGTNTASGENVEIRIASGDASNQLEEETYIYNALAGCPGIPLIDSFTVNGHHVMAYAVLGPSLEVLLTAYSDWFTLKTALPLFNQILTLLESIHDRSFIHRDIKLDNFRMGIGTNRYQVNLTSFASAKQYRNPKTKVHMPLLSNNKLASTVFASINTHLGNEQSCCDDLESFGYVMLHLLGGLPWQDTDNVDRILEMKKDIKNLCRNLDPEFEIYLNYTRSLPFDEKPDYDFLRNLFRGLFIRKDFLRDKLQEDLTATFKHNYEKLSDGIEIRCIKADSFLNTIPKNLWQPNIWRAAFKKHKYFLDLSHEILLTSEDPLASPVLRQIPSTFQLHTRVWEHAIHSFLELLRDRLPASRNCMLSFIYLAYSTMTVFLEEFPCFEDTWLEHLGDLSRYAWYTSGNSIWASTARRWYSKASAKSPMIGKFHDYLAIFVPNALQQLFHYSISLCAEVPYTETRKSILALFNSVRDRKIRQPQSGSNLFETAFLTVHGILFTSEEAEPFAVVVETFLCLANIQFDQVTCEIAIINITAMLRRGSFLTSCIAQNAVSKDEEKAETAVKKQAFQNARLLNNSTLEIVLQRNGDPNVLQFVHINLVFMLMMAHHPRALDHLKLQFPWEKMSIMLNTLQCIKVPRPQKGGHFPLPEVTAMRDLGWTENYLGDELGESRTERILSLGHHLAKLGCGLSYNCSEQKFSVLSSPSTIESEEDTHKAIIMLSQGRLCLYVEIASSLYLNSTCYRDDPDLLPKQTPSGRPRAAPDPDYSLKDDGDGHTKADGNA